jgi:hypothetical protein
MILEYAMGKIIICDCRAAHYAGRKHHFFYMSQMVGICTPIEDFLNFAVLHLHKRKHNLAAIMFMTF